MPDDEHSDQDLATIVTTWTDRLSPGNQGWDRPQWLRQTLALLLTADMRGHFTEVEKDLMTALAARLRYRAGEPPIVGDRPDDWRERAYIATKRALETMASEPVSHRPGLRRRHHRPRRARPRVPPRGHSWPQQRIIRTYERHEYGAVGIPGRVRQL